MTTIGRIKSFLSRLRMRLYCRVFGHDWMFSRNMGEGFGVKWCAKCKKIDKAITANPNRPWRW